MTGETFEWRQQLSTAQRTTIQELHRLQPWRNMVILLFLAVWAAGAIAGYIFPVWPVRFAGYLVIGAVLHSLAIIMHEASHFNLTRKRRWDRWLGFLCGAPAVLSCSAYRVVHLAHHRHVRGPLDPEEFNHLTKHRWSNGAVFYVWAVVGGLLYLFFVPIVGLKRGNWRDRRDILLEYLLIGTIYGLLMVLAARNHFLPEVLHSLALPLAVTILLTNVRGLSEHALTTPGDPLRQTRAVTSNWLVRSLMCNANYHLEHHLYPTMPWYNLPKLHKVLSENYRQDSAFVSRSYVAHVWAALRTGLYGRAPAQTSRR